MRALDNFNINFSKWAKKNYLARKLTFLLIITAICLGVATYSAITRSSSPFGPDPHLVLGLILSDLAMLLILVILVSRRLFALWIVRGDGPRGSRLQKRIVMMFSLVSAVPTVTVAVFSALFFNYGIQSWFDQKVSTALEDSVAVAEAYLKEHQVNIRADAIDMAYDLNSVAYPLMTDPDAINQALAEQAMLRVLSEGLIFRGDKRILAKTRLSFSLQFELDRLPQEVIDQADKGEVVVLTNEKDKVRALIKLIRFPETYLLVGRPIDSKILAYLQNTQGAVSEYMRLKTQISKLQIEFSFVFLIVALLLLLSAMSLGIMFAGAIAKPISRLVAATEKVKAGDLTVRVKEGHENDELAILSKAFNGMTAQLKEQRDELIDASKQIDARRHFSETVITGVSAGIIVLDQDKKISMINRSAANLLNLLLAEVINQPFAKYFPEMEELLLQAEHLSDYSSNKEISIIRGNRKLILLAKAVAEQLDHNVVGYIVTFDDVTDLIIAQRSAAWSDVARRIAHEIKNPLTPIRLAAERLRKKILAYPSADQEGLAKYTNTIIRHVTDIGKIVEEFVNFARMPAPSFYPSDICEQVNNAVFSRQCVATNISYHVQLPQNQVIVNCDVSQIAQVLLNVFKNAEESIECKAMENGQINIKVIPENKMVAIIVSDTGAGFPEHLMNRLTEPYVTSKTKGTGLGLAIVKKIIDDHNGSMQFSNNSEGGATAKIFLPIYSV